MTDETTLSAEYIPSLNLRVVFECQPEEKPVLHGPGICAGSPEYIGVLAVMVGETNILPGLSRECVREIEDEVRVEIKIRREAA